MRDAITCYLVVQAMALAVWPLVAIALAPLDDRGWAAAKSFGLLAVAWLVWFVCMLTPVPYTRATLLLGLLAVGAGGWAWAWHSRALESMFAWMRERRALLV